MGQKGKKDLFLENGSKLFEGLITSTDGKYENPIRFFSSKELKKATNNYDSHRRILQDSYFTLYKGYHENRNIIIKRYDYEWKRDCEWMEMCTKDVVMTSLMVYHKNVVKLLGCCLETPVPTPVLEFMPNGSLEDHLFGNPYSENRLLLSLETRLRIANEIANVVTYLHIAFSRPVVFRNLNVRNILLDEQCVAKLQDFTLSMSIPDGETHIEDAVRGTVGWGAPEYIKTGCFTEKIDVYNFGIFLSMLLTGRKAFSIDCDQRLIDDYVRMGIKNNGHIEIVDPVLRGLGMDELKQQQLRMILELAVRCFQEDPEQRPSMIEVAKELRRIQRLM